MPREGGASSIDGWRLLDRPPSRAMTAEARTCVHGVASVQGNRALRLGDELVRHLAEALDLGLHHVADVDERVGALADAAAGAADEDVAGLDAEGGRCGF